MTADRATLVCAIVLTKVRVALVDLPDYEELAQFPWFCSNAGYPVGKMGGKKTLLMHRVIMRAPEGMVVDHINHDLMDNRRANLRICTHRQNLMNRKADRRRRGKTSIYKGVCYDKRERRWMAYIHNQGSFTGLGYYTDEDSAALAYNDAAIHLFGDFALLNTIGTPS